MELMPSVVRQHAGSAYRHRWLPDVTSVNAGNTRIAATEDIRLPCRAGRAATRHQRAYREDPSENKAHGAPSDERQRRSS